jgi:hypothetical protein
MQNFRVKYDSQPCIVSCLCLAESMGRQRKQRDIGVPTSRPYKLIIARTASGDGTLNKLKFCLDL